jgi:hypothetical protein
MKKLLSILVVALMTLGMFGAASAEVAIDVFQLKVESIRCFRSL